MFLEFDRPAFIHGLGRCPEVEIVGTFYQMSRSPNVVNILLARPRESKGQLRPIYASGIQA